MKNRESQALPTAHTIVGIILIIIIFYIIFLPPGEREALLGGEDNESHATSKEEETNATLLREFPGTLSYLSKRTVDKTIPNVYLIETTNSKELASFNPFRVRNGVFDNTPKTIEFGIDDLKNTNNLKLSFTAKTHKGVLTIKLNGNIIYENKITTTNIDPINLMKSYLKEGNTLEFSVDSVGFRFWRTNEYNLDKVKITGDITDIDRQKSENVFTLTTEEYQNLEESNMKFIPYCGSERDIGVLDVSINNRKIYSAVPVCDDLVKQEFSTGVLDAGENSVVFQSTRGSYSIEQIDIDIRLKEAKSLVYYFEVNESEYEKIDNGEKDAILHMIFIDDDKEKNFELNVNDHLRRVEQDEKEYSRNIGNWIEEGNNYIEIVPKTTLNIVEITVWLREK